MFRHLPTYSPFFAFTAVSSLYTVPMIFVKGFTVFETNFQFEVLIVVIFLLKIVVEILIFSRTVFYSEFLCYSCVSPFL